MKFRFRSHDQESIYRPFVHHAYEFTRTYDGKHGLDAPSTWRTRTWSYINWAGVWGILAVLGIYELGAIHPSDQPLRLGERELTGSEIMSWFGVFFLTLYIPAVFGIAGSKSKRRESLAAISKDALALPAMPGRTLLGRSSAASA